MVICDRFFGNEVIVFVMKQINFDVVVVFLIIFLIEVL